jgi:hypothetical protein
VSSTAFLDASVLYPSTVRSVLMFLAAFGTFRPLWSDDVHREWTAALTRDRPDLDTKRIARTRELMESNVPGATITGYQGRIADLVLPDANDRHVLAAALHGKADVIVTTNLKHFPASVLATHGITAQHPDLFIHGLIAADIDSAVQAFAADRARMANPPKSVDDYLASLVVSGLVKTAAALRDVAWQL